MTKLDFTKAVANGNITEEIIAFAKAEVEKYETKQADKIAEKQALIDAITAVFKANDGKALTAKEIADNTDITVQKAVALLKAMDEVDAEKTIQGTKVVNVYNFIG